MNSANLARRVDNDTVSHLRPEETVVQETGRVVVLRDGGGVLVEAASGQHEATRAVSCLVAPEVEDVVLLARSSREGAFVLAVLRRGAGAGTTVVVDGDLDVRLTAGRFRVAAQEGVELITAGTVSVVGRGIDVNASEGNVVVSRLALLGDAVIGEFQKVKLLASTFDSVLERLSQRVKRSYRTVEETDQLRAERVDYTAEKTMSLHGEHTLVTADQLVKMDAEQIHLG